MKKSVFYDHLIEACSQSGLPIEQAISKIRDMGVDAVEINLTMLLNDEEHISRILRAQRYRSIQQQNMMREGF